LFKHKEYRFHNIEHVGSANAAVAQAKVVHKTRD
jgi:hypothetical protein